MWMARDGNVEPVTPPVPSDTSRSFPEVTYSCVKSLYCWCSDMPLNVCIHEAAIDSRQTGVDWANFCREECATYTSRNLIQIGGFDANGSPIVVEIDETKYFHRKYHRGHWHEGHWVFGGTERT